MERIVERIAAMPWWVMAAIAISFGALGYAGWVSLILRLNANGCLI